MGWLARRLAALGVAALGLSSCASGASGRVGAVVVRWRIVSGAEGMQQSQCEVCIGGCSQPGTNVCAGSCPRSGGVVATVDAVELVVTDPAGAPVTCDGCRFSCRMQEGTTPFTIPAGTYLFSLRALSCGARFGETPPPVLRDVRAGEITNLDAIEILVPDTATPPSCGAAGTDGG